MFDNTVPQYARWAVWMTDANVAVQHTGESALLGKGLQICSLDSTEASNAEPLSNHFNKGQSQSKVLA